MDLADQITNDIKSAMRNKETTKLSTLRMLKSTIKNKEIDIKQTLDDTDIIIIIRTMIKQRQESVSMFTKGGRDDLVTIEKEEIEILSSYLPQSLSPEEIEELVQGVIQEIEATSLKEMGAVMKAAQIKTEGRVDGKTLSTAVKNSLNSL